MYCKAGGMPILGHRIPDRKREEKIRKMAA
jgi:hypothetical protein